MRIKVAVAVTLLAIALALAALAVTRSAGPEHERPPAAQLENDD